MNRGRRRGLGRGRTTTEDPEAGDATIPQVLVEGLGVAQEMLNTMRVLAETAMRGVQAPKSRASVAMRDFQRLDPPTFSGEPDPQAATAWLEMMTRILDTLLITEDELRIDLATFQLRGDADEWWEFVKTTINGTWASFSKVFLEKYFPESSKDVYREEFLALTQGSLSVIQYEAKFTSLSKFAPEMVSTEELRAKYFESGLRPAIMNEVVALRLRVFSELVETAIIVENGLAEACKGGDGRPTVGSGSASSSGQQFKKRKFGGDRPFYAGAPSQSRLAPTLSTASIGRTDPRDGLCFTCGRPGHKAKKCPQTIRVRTLIICFQCGQQGHKERDCQQMGITPSTSSAPRGQSSQSRQGQAQHQQRSTTKSSNTGGVVSSAQSMRPLIRGTQDRAYALVEPSPAATPIIPETAVGSSVI